MLFNQRLVLTTKEFFRNMYCHGIKEFISGKNICRSNCPNANQN